MYMFKYGTWEFLMALNDMKTHIRNFEENVTYFDENVPDNEKSWQHKKFIKWCETH